MNQRSPLEHPSVLAPRRRATGWQLKAIAAVILSTSFLELGLGSGLASGQATPTAQEIATSIQRKYDTIRDFSADFVHTHEGGVLKRKRIERGTLLVKKPGKMRWTYQAPDEKVFVSDGVRLIQYFPDENRAVVSEVPDDDQAAVLFLAGRGHLTRDFNVSFSQGGSDAGVAWTLRLEPRKPQPEYRLAGDRGRPRYARASVADSGGKTGQPLHVRLYEFQGKHRISR